MKGQAPLKQFFHGGTKYIVTGNEQFAQDHFHEIRSHLQQLKRINVNNLPIVSGSKEFDDGTVASYSINYGIEIVNIFAPSLESNKEKKDTMLMEKLVPCIRSDDNLYWIACLSGTFEPPYYCFKNTLDITAEQMDDANETELDKKKIGTGKTYVEDSIDLPELFFIAQTGKRDEGTTIAFDQGTGDILQYESVFADPRYTLETINDSDSGSTWLDYLLTTSGTWSYCPEAAAQYGRGCVLGWDISYSNRHYMLRQMFYDGENAAAHDYITDESSTRSGTASSAVRTGLIGGGCEYDPVGPIGNATFELEGFLGTCVEKWDSSVPFYTGVSIESPGKLACCFDDVIFKETHNQTAGGGCIVLASGNELPWTRKVTYKRQYTFRVEESEGVFYSPPEFIDYGFGEDYWEDPTGSELIDGDPDNYDCVTPSNSLKYYGEQNIGIMCGTVRKYILNVSGLPTSSECLGFYYNYIGPRKDYEISTTLFIPEESTTKPFRHIIPNVLGIDDDVKFGGEVFLGKIRYNTEKK